MASGYNNFGNIPDNEIPLVPATEPRIHQFDSSMQQHTAALEVDATAPDVPDVFMGMSQHSSNQSTFVPVVPNPYRNTRSDQAPELPSAYMDRENGLITGIPQPSDSVVQNSSDLEDSGWETASHQGNDLPDIMDIEPEHPQPVSIHDPTLHISTPDEEIRLDAGQADRIPALERSIEQQWLLHKATIERLYLEEGKSLREVMEFLKGKKHFDQNLSSYKKKLREWGFDKKNFRPRHRDYVQRVDRKRQASGKPRVYHGYLRNGVIIPAGKVKRMLESKNEPAPTCTSPTSMSHHTGQVEQQPRPPTEQSCNIRSIGIRSLSDLKERSSVPNEPDVDVEQLQDRLARAKQLEENGDHEDARLAYLGLLDDLQSTVWSCHTFTAGALGLFAEFCLRRNFSDDAEHRLRTSLAHHEEKYERQSHQTLFHMVALGRFYRSIGNRGASKLLLEQALGIWEELKWDNMHDRFDMIIRISGNLNNIYRELNSFENMERILLQMQALAEKYQPPEDVTFVKHQLIHLYCDEWSRYQVAHYAVPPEDKGFRLLLEEMERIDAAGIISFADVCLLDKLLKIYRVVPEPDQLEGFGAHLCRIEHVIKAGVTPVSPGTQRGLMSLKQPLARVYTKLAHYERAEELLTSLQPEIHLTYGPDSEEAFYNILYTALLYLQQGDWKKAEPTFRSAREKSETIFGPENEIQGKIDDCLERNSWEAECPNCELRDMKAEQAELNFYEIRDDSEQERLVTTPDGHVYRLIPFSG